MATVVEGDPTLVVRWPEQSFGLVGADELDADPCGLGDPFEHVDRFEHDLVEANRLIASAQPAGVPLGQEQKLIDPMLRGFHMAVHQRGGAANSAGVCGANNFLPLRS